MHPSPKPKGITPLEGGRLRRLGLTVSVRGSRVTWKMALRSWSVGIILMNVADVGEHS